MKIKNKIILNEILSECHLPISESCVYNDGRTKSFTIKKGECENYHIIVNLDEKGEVESFYNLYFDNPCGSNNYDTIEDIYDDIILKENKGTWRANPSHWRY